MIGQHSPESKIFINYRRDDTRWVAGRLMDTLKAYFGDDRVFRDVEGIAGGVDFGNYIHQTMNLSHAVIVLIGPEWLTVTNDDGQRRLDDPKDWVAQEIEVALKQDVAIFPVLVDDTPMPRKEELPDALKPLVDRNAMSISEARWDNDVVRLAKTIAIDVPGSAAEKILDQVRLLISVLLFIAVTLTTGILTLNATEADKERGWWMFDEGWGRKSANASNTPSVTPVNTTSQNKADGVDDPVLLQAWHLSFNFVTIIASSILLLVSAPLVDPSRRKYFYASGLVGFGGTAVCYFLVWPLAPAVEPVALFFGSTIVITGMFALMNLSGFKAK